MPIVNITKPVTKPTETISGTAYTLVIGDKDRVKTWTLTTNTVVTIPADTTTNFPIGTQIGFIKQNTGKVNIVPAVGVTLNSIDNKRFIKGTHGTAAIIKTAANSWTLAGSLEAS